MKKILFILTLVFLLGQTNSLLANDKFVLVIDAGHGGKDGGATRGNYKEKDINLGVALALGQLVESNLKNVKVVYTRKSDVFLNLYKRSEIANKAKANMFISIHTNSTAAKITTAQGADTYILGLARSEENLAVAKRENSVILLEDNYNKRYEGFDPNSPESNILFEFMTDKYMSQSLEFASQVQKGFTNIAKRKDRGVRQAGFLVLRESAMPSVLIELGFINNPLEAKYLSSSAGQRSMASAIFAGVEKYIRDFEKKQGYLTTTATVKEEVPAIKAKSDKKEKNNKETPKSVLMVSAETPEPETFENDTNSIVDAEIKEESTFTPIFVVKEAHEGKASFDNSSATLAVPSETQPEGIALVEKAFALSRNDADNVPIVRKSNTKRVVVSKPAETSVAPKQPAKPAPAPASEAKIATSGAVEYRVQIATSDKKLPANSPHFKGLSPVKEYKDGNIYKYTYGSTESESKIIQIRNQIRPKFKDAFVVKFRGGERIK